MSFIWRCPYLRGFIKYFQVVEQDGLWYHVNQIQFNSNRSDVIEYGLPMVCGLYYTIQTIRYHKIFIHAPIKTYPDYSVFD